MPLSLYDAIVPSFLQILRALPGLLDKAEAFAATSGTPIEELIGARLADDMLPFAYQIAAAVSHSARAIEATRVGLFTPDLAPPPGDVATLRAVLADAIAALEAIDPAELDGWAGRDMRFEFKEWRLEFTAEDFLLSFSQPNFYFHATTAYAILRMKGVALGKTDFVGALRLRG